MFVYELSGFGFEPSCSHLNFRYGACFEQEFPWHSGNYRVWIHSEARMWHDKNIQSQVFKFVVEWIHGIRNNVEITLSPKVSLLLLQFLMSNYVQFVCLWRCAPSDSVVHINNFFSLVLFSAVIHKRRGKKLNCKTIKYKLDSSSKMQFVFCYPKDIQIFFGKLSILSKIWEWPK